jgi:hypothetical protein
MAIYQLTLFLATYHFQLLNQPTTCPFMGNFLGGASLKCLYLRKLTLVSSVNISFPALKSAGQIIMIGNFSRWDFLGTGAFMMTDFSI